MKKLPHACFVFFNFTLFSSYYLKNSIFAAQEMTSSANQCLLGTVKRKRDCGWEGVCFSLSLVPFCMGSREPLEGTYTSHFPIHCTDYALSRCLCFHFWWYGRVLLINIRCGKSFISESSVPPCRNLPLLVRPFKIQACYLLLLQLSPFSFHLDHPHS